MGWEVSFSLLWRCSVLDVVATPLDALDARRAAILLVPPNLAVEPLAVSFLKIPSSGMN